MFLVRSPYTDLCKTMLSRLCPTVKNFDLQGTKTEFYCFSACTHENLWLCLDISFVFIKYIEILIHMKYLVCSVSLICCSEKIYELLSYFIWLE